MPLRVGTRAPLAAAADALLSSSSRIPTTTAAATQTCAFSTTPARERMTAGRRKMYQFLESRRGRELADGRGSNQYIGGRPGQPFPNNPLFRSEPVVNEPTRRIVHQKAVKDGQALKAIAAEMGLDVRRVAAIVRLEEAKKQWVADGKQLARPYAKAVHERLPKWGFWPDEPSRNQPFEPVNDIHVHRYTMQQLFVPVSESREFTRKHAAAAFYDGMLPVDARSPQRGLIAMERKNIAEPKRRKEHRAEFEEAERQREDDFAATIAERAEADEAATRRVYTDRYEFRFREMNADDAGADGRSPKGLGARYGAPHLDRKRGQVKIPTSMP